MNPEGVESRDPEQHVTNFLVPPIRPEERFISNQQQQLLQAANAQHMAAMVALEAMQNHAKVGTANSKFFLESIYTSKHSESLN